MSAKLCFLVECRIQGRALKGSGHISVSTRELPGSRNKRVLEGHSKKLVMVAPVGRRAGVG